MPHNKRFPLFIFTVSCVAFTVGNPLARAAILSPTCKTVMDANDKQYTTPVHLYITKSGVSSEGIVASNAMYMKASGKWQRSPFAPKDMLEIRREALKEAKSLDCRHLRDEAVNGEAAAVYSMDTVTDNGHSNGQIWISKSRGLPLKSELDVMRGSDKKHTSVRYDYTNVQAPASVK